MQRRGLGIVLAAAAAALLLAPAAADAQFETGLQDATLNGLGPNVINSEPGYAAVGAIGGSYVRVNMPWVGVAGQTPFNLSNPSDSHYRWARWDEAVRRAAAHHLQVLFMFYDAPAWAEGPGAPVGNPNVGTGAWEPSAALYGQFMHAVATRYSGSFPDPLRPGASLPRVENFELWNEPNLGGYVAGPNTVDEFRALLNAGYAAVKSVHSDNYVIAGALAPIAPAGVYSVHPVIFAQRLLCLRRSGRHYARVSGCQSPQFDALGVHPYSLAATPTKPANDSNDVLVPDTYKLRNLLRAAERLHTIGGRRHPIWVTEWSWFTNPPQGQYGDPPAVAGRYVAYSLYEFWKDGVSLVFWQVLADVIGGPNPGGGLETTAGVPKPTMHAFGFPFIASVNRGKGYAWGRAPNSSRTRVFVEHRVRGKWRRVATVRTDRWGVLTAHFRAHGNGTYRARTTHGSVSLPYFSAKIPAKRTHPYTFG